MECESQGFPTDQVAQLAAVCFYAGIASILGLYTIFWLGLNLLAYLASPCCAWSSDSRKWLPGTISSGKC